MLTWLLGLRFGRVCRAVTVATRRLAFCSLSCEEKPDSALRLLSAQCAERAAQCDMASDDDSDEEEIEKPPERRAPSGRAGMGGRMQRLIAEEEDEE